MAGLDLTPRLVLLGTAGGPTTPVDGDGGARFGIASALVIEGFVYLVDCGQGVDRQLRLAGLGEGADGGFERLDSIYLTHLHCDHTVDYFNLFLYGAGSGLRQVPRPVRVFGPGSRGALPPYQGSGPEPRPVTEEQPMPGTVAMTDRLFDAYASDLNDRIRNSRKLDVRTVLQVEDIDLPEIPGFISPDQTPHPMMKPFVLHTDERVRVTATLVQHAPVFPAFAFRFDTAYGSVVFSGDTGPSDNLIRLAADADILVHEVLDHEWLEGFAPADDDAERAAVLEHLRSSHTMISEVGPVAEAAGVETLVLSHLVPGSAPRERWLRAGEGFSGRLIVGEDLLQIPLPGALTTAPGGAPLNVDDEVTM